eukprot:COSAG06_NODE_3242_length_5628_cov_1.674806_2_plen_63_part_00
MAVGGRRCSGGERGGGGRQRLHGSGADSDASGPPICEGMPLLLLPPRPPANGGAAVIHQLLA